MKTRIMKSACIAETKMANFHLNLTKYTSCKMEIRIKYLITKKRIKIVNIRNNYKF